MSEKRYSSIAISLHWLIAILLAGLVIAAKVMNSLADDDPLRFTIIQWHKSVGILVLLLVLARIVWRFTHKPPRLGPSIKKWERLASGGTHFLLYLLMLAIPLSGWLMVSASPLNLKTELFGLIPWPHVYAVSELPNKAEVAERLVDVHHWLANGMLLLALLHMAAALRHQFILRDRLIARMVISADHKASGDLAHGIFYGILIAVAGALFLYAQNIESIDNANAGSDDVERVGFEASQLGEPLVGVFKEAEVILSLDAGKVAQATLNASIDTASVSTGDSQIDATVVTSDWFASGDYPQATFASSSIVEIAETRFEVTGELTIRDVSQEITFLMTLEEGVARGEFLIDRTGYGVGTGGQDEFVAPEVRINFSVRAN